MIIICTFHAAAPHKPSGALRVLMCFLMAAAHQGAPEEEGPSEDSELWQQRRAHNHARSMCESDVMATTAGQRCSHKCRCVPWLVLGDKHRSENGNVAAWLLTATSCMCSHCSPCVCPYRHALLGQRLDIMCVFCPYAAVVQELQGMQAERAHEELLNDAHQQVAWRIQ